MQAINEKRAGKNYIKQIKSTFTIGGRTFHTGGCMFRTGGRTFRTGERRF